MPIQNINNTKEILKNFKTEDWTKSTKIEGFKVDDFSALELPSASSKPESFAEVLGKSLAQVNNLQLQANTAIQKLSSGESKSIHETMLAVEKAEIAFKSMNQIRIKVIDAYKQVMQMQV